MSRKDFLDAEARLASQSSSNAHRALDSLDRLAEQRDAEQDALGDPLPRDARVQACGICGAARAPGRHWATWKMNVKSVSFALCGACSHVDLDAARAYVLSSVVGADVPIPPGVVVRTFSEAVIAGHVPSVGHPRRFGYIGEAAREALVAAVAAHEADHPTIAFLDADGIRVPVVRQEAPAPPVPPAQDDLEGAGPSPDTPEPARAAVPAPAGRRGLLRRKG